MVTEIKQSLKSSQLLCHLYTQYFHGGTVWANSVYVFSELIILFYDANFPDSIHCTKNEIETLLNIKYPTLAFHREFIYFLYGWKQKWILYKKYILLHFALTVFLNYLIKHKVTQNRRSLPAMHSVNAVSCNFAENYAMFVFYYSVFIF